VVIEGSSLCLESLLDWRVLVLALTLTFNLALAFRPIANEDTGYHLAYGESILDGQGIVDDSRWIHPAPTPAEAEGMTMPPGAWFDGQGRYRFINANWLSQVVMAGVWRIGGGTGLTLLNVALVGASLGFLGLAMRRWGLGTGAIGAAWLICGAANFERYNLRPELFSHAIFTAMLWLLAGTAARRTMFAAAALQVLAVNLHSYWVFNLAIAAAGAGEAAMRWIGAAIRRGDAADPRRRLGMAAAVTAAMAGASVVNPWGLRGATMPIQTGLYLQREHIAGSAYAEAARRWDAGRAHPWEMIQEFQWPFDPAADRLSTRAMEYVMIAGMGAWLALLIRRRWSAWLLTTFAIVVGVQMRRNMVPATLLIAPAVMIALQPLARRLPRWSAVGPAAIGAALTIAVIGGWWYAWADWPQRFAAGLLEPSLRVPVARFLDENQARARPAFVSFNISSNLMYFSKSVTGVTVLTNTWAAPPQRLADHWRMTTTGLEIEPWLSEAGIDIVVLDATKLTQNLILRLSTDPAWALVWADEGTAVFARRTAENAAMIGRSKATLEKMGLAPFGVR
jgi:hypothetical protein